MNMDTPEKKPASSIANRPRVTDNATTNLKKRIHIIDWKMCTQMCQMCLKTFTYCLSSVSYCSCVKSKGKQAFTLFSCKVKVTNWCNHFLRHEEKEAVPIPMLLLCDGQLPPDSLHFQHPLSNLSTISPLHMSKACQPRFSDFISKPLILSHLSSTHF